MTSFDSSPIDALEGMLEERRRYEGWLAQLDARRGDAPAHVVDRVRSDYAHRLEGVTQQLRDRATDLEASATGLRERIATLLHEESLHRDERAELELRALVGEYEPDRAQGSIASCDESIARLEGERHGFEHELTRIVDVLALVTPAPAALEPDVVAIEDLAEEAHVESSDFATGGAAPGETQVSTTSPDTVADEVPLASNPSHMDELAFLQSVVDLPPEEPAIASSADVDAQGRARQEGESGMLPPPLLTVPRRAETPQSTAVPGGREPYGIPTKGSMLTPGSMPSFFKDMPTEQVKTLKCQECGTMNYPTEWYCERCGGELATM